MDSDFVKIAKVLFGDRPVPPAQSVEVVRRAGLQQGFRLAQRTFASWARQEGYAEFAKQIEAAELSRKP